MRPKYDYASVAWNSNTSTEAKNAWKFERKFVAVCYKHPPTKPPPQAKDFHLWLHISV
jgi:hypothetical protein